MTLVVDASTVVAAIIDSDEHGRWAEDQLASDRLVGPELLLVEVAHVLRRAEQNGHLDSTSAALAFASMNRLPVELFPFSACADRIWELRSNVTVYDACYVALAELLDAPLATLDLKLTKAPTTRCSFVTPHAAG